jgi:hypothetical protein
VGSRARRARRRQKCTIRRGGVSGGAQLAELELVKDGGLAGGVEANHQDAHLLLAEHALPNAGESETHGVGEL